MTRFAFALALLLGLPNCAGPPPCAPTCDGRSCGPDGCGSSCGECDGPEICVAGGCTLCGNDALDPGETCDDSAGAPCEQATDCRSDDPCAPASYTGSAATCDATCVRYAIAECRGGDACCPNGCTAANDPECAPPTCGNGRLDAGETCDPPSVPCPSACAAPDPCVTASLVGFPEACSQACQLAPITVCDPAPDGCCPAGCSDDDDGDCAPDVCGDGVVSPSEMCDNGLAWPLPGSCSPDCDDNRPCTVDHRQGGPQTCDVVCHGTPTTACLAGDSCCPVGCDDATDADCALVVCGDGVVDGREACDSAIPLGEPGACPTSVADCDDADPCTTDTFSGDSADCSARCGVAPRDCDGTDGCCPAQCSAAADRDCAALDLCTTYCFEAITYCIGAYEIFDDIASCRAACAAMPTGRPDDASGDSVHCRIHHLYDARTDPESHCAHASSSPIDGCN